MNKKSFFLGLISGIVLSFIVLIVIGLVNQDSISNDPIQYLDTPVNYENKTETSFKVLQVISKNAALATEESEYDMFLGNTVMILGENYYSDQIITVKNPMRVGTYSYTNKGGMPMTVPVIDAGTK